MLTYAYTTRVRSLVLATFLVGRGIVPIDVVLIDGQPVFRFPPEETYGTIDRFVAIKRKLAALEHTAQSERPADSSEPARASSGSTL